MITTFGQQPIGGNYNSNISIQPPFVVWGEETINNSNWTAENFQTSTSWSAENLPNTNWTPEL